MNNRSQQPLFSSEFRTKLKAWRHRAWLALKHFWYRFQLGRWCLVVLLTFILVMSTYLTFVAKTAHVTQLQSRLSQPTMVYDHNGKSAGSLYSQKGTYVSLSKISSNVPDAVLSTEDRRFYHEHGFSVRGLGRAGFLLIKNKLLHRNYISGGGSTITQQLVKNAFLTQQQTFSRKAKEIFIAIEVENKYSKKQILTMYLNNAYFGHGVWGVQDAARRYFNTDAANLTVPQAATLAAMLRSPGIYDPVSNPKAAKSRRNLVLQLMVANHKLTQSQANTYKKTPLTVSNGYYQTSTYRYPYYFDAVISEAYSRYGLSEKQVMNNGYKIYTTLDQGQQKAMQETFADDSNFPANASDGTKVQAASIAINPKTGGVTAIVGGRGTHVFRGFNRATQMRRQPGSTIKPLVVYTPALQKGYFYDSTLQDKKQSYGTNNYTPKNYNDQYSGHVPMYKALYESLNAPAVWLLDKIGVNAGYNSAKAFGLPVTSKDKNLALGLGGMTNGVSAQQLARAYTAFANNGKMAQTHYITKIVDSSGKTIDTYHARPAKRVMSAKIAKEMTSMMLDVYKVGTGATAKPSGYELAGKTGTTDTGQADTAGGDRDRWIVGYTPDVVVATWEGFDDTSKNHVLVDSTDVGISKIFKSEMTALLPETAGTKFNITDAQKKATASSSSSSTSKGLNDFFNQAKNSDLSGSAKRAIQSAGQKAQQAINSIENLLR